MRYIAIDLETTGFDPETCEIIEVGAVRFEDGRPAAEFSSLVRAAGPVPPEVVTLTGIDPAAVATAPPAAEVLAALRAFAGADPVVGHNVAFDLGFLAQAGLHLGGVAFDTYDLAAATQPAITRMDLHSLAEALGVGLDRWHRALDDARAAGAIFAELVAQLDAMPRSVRVTLAGFARRAGSPLAGLLEPPPFSPASAPPGGAPALDPPADAAAGALGRLPPPLPPPLAPREEWEAIAAAEVATLFATLEDRSHAEPELLPGFRRRAEQERYAAAVAGAQGTGAHLAVEAGTGTGKSLGYLLPSALLAARSGRRVVVSTHTLNLQEQLVERDLPAALRAVEAHEGLPAGALRGAALKGRANYLCLERWTALAEGDGPLDGGSARLASRLAVWLGTTATGDRAELWMAPDERDGWARLSAGDADCLARRCAFVRDGSCFVLRARARAAAAHVLVVNHALLLADAAAGHAVLPPFDHLVVDEAHRLEGVATEQYGRRVGVDELAALAAEATNPQAGGVGATLRHHGPGAGALFSPIAGLAAVAEEVATAGARLADRIPDFERALRGYLEEFGDGPPGDRRGTLTAARRAQPAWEDVEEAAMQVDLVLHLLGRALERGQQVVQSLPEETLPGGEEVPVALRRAHERTAAARAVLRDGVLVRGGAGGDIVWVHDARRGPAVHLAPLEVGPRLGEEVFADATSVVATSATMRLDGRFDFLSRAIGLREPDTLAVPSPFDYRRAVLTLVVEDIAEPGEPAYEADLERALAAAAIAAGGRTLALFTSHRAVRQAAAALREPLREAEIGLLAQSIDGSPGRVLRQLVGRPRSLVLGTAAFWEGVDVRGDTLSQVAVTRLPFPVPTDPVYAGRAELYVEPFEELALPQALLRFRQGFGRLIRGPQERGVFLVLDRRVLTRSYGDRFLGELPDAEVRRVRIDDLAREVRRWLDG